MYDWNFGGSAKGDLLSSLASMGEYTVVASANLGVRGTLSDDTDASDDFLSRCCKGSGRFFSVGAEAMVSCLYGQLLGSSD
jgi:hypothetical protein